MRYRTRVVLIVALFAAVGSLASRSISAESTPPKRVLLLLPFEASRPGSAVFLKGIEEGLKVSYSGGVDIATENVGPVPPEPENFPARIDDWIAFKYGRLKFDAIVAVTFPPSLLAKDLRDRFWPEATLLLVLIDEERWANPGSIPRSTRVLLDLDNKETVRSALQMLPDTRRVVVLGGASQRDRRTNAEIVKSIRNMKPDLEIIEATGLSLEEAKARIRSLPDRTIIVIGSFLFEPNGQRLDVPQLVDEFYPSANAPLFADSDMAMGKGIVGGAVLSVQGAAEVVGEQLGQLLKGADPDPLPVREVKNSFIVDWRQLKRWGISERTLPPGATILYRQPTAWEQYGRYIVGLLSVLIVLLFLVAFLLLERQRRKKEEDLSSAMLESLPGMALLVNRQGEILRTNQIRHEAAAAEGNGLDGARPGFKYSEYLRKLAGQEDGFAGAAAIEQVIAGERAGATAELPLSSEGRWIEVRAIQLPNQQSGSLVVHLDITQRKQAELEHTRSRTEIYHLNRVAAMGQLAASLAHELSQPLAAIMSNAEAAQRFAGRPNPDMVEIREALDDITRDDKRARGVIQGMRSMLKKQSVVIEPVDLNQIATSVVQMIRNEAALRGVRIEMGLLPSAVMVKGDQIALQQVVLNLAGNGLDAMMDSTEERRLTLRTTIEQVARVGAIWVEDSGPGVSAEVREKLFQPFFTTKTTGLGMGLSICQSILESLGGRIDLKDPAGKGAVFFVELPLA
jgi:C4-dicarboxylate-specific signal transduction histidine kinase